MSTGYSSTPLAKKLGLKDGHRVVLIDAPIHYWDLFDQLPESLEELNWPVSEVDFMHAFFTSRTQMEAMAESIKKALHKMGSLWVSWPKGSSKIPHDMHREHIRETFLKTGLVDSKVAAIDADWSGLKFTYRVKDR